MCMQMCLNRPRKFYLHYKSLCMPAWKWQMFKYLDTQVTLNVIVIKYKSKAASTDKLELISLVWFMFASTYWLYAHFTKSIHFKYNTLLNFCVKCLMELYIYTYLKSVLYKIPLALIFWFNELTLNDFRSSSFLLPACALSVQQMAV